MTARAGGFSDIDVVSMAIIGLAILYALFYVYMGVDKPNPTEVTGLRLLLVDYGFAASFVAILLSLEKEYT